MTESPAIESFNNAEGRRVVTADTAEEAGKIMKYIIDPTGHRIHALQIGGGLFKSDVAVLWSDVTAFGGDAVMIRSGSAVSDLSGDREEAVAKGKIHLRQTKVLMTSGFEAGEVTDARFDTRTGLLETIETDQGSIPASRVRSLGSYALVVDPAPTGPAV